MSTRKQQGELIARVKGSIKRLDDRNYIVNSQSGNGMYGVKVDSIIKGKKLEIFPGNSY